MKTRSAFAHRDFRLVTLGRFLFGLAVQIQAVVIGWQVYEIKRDPLFLGLIGLTEAVPAISVALVSGYIVDRANPLKIYQAVIGLSLLSAMLLLGAGGSLGWIYVGAFLTGVARGFASPALYSLVPQLIPREILHTSSAWITSAFHIAAVSGPAIGGLMYAWKGPSLSYLIVAVMLALAFFSLRLLTPRTFHRASESGQFGEESEPLFGRITSGIRFVFGHELLLSALALDMFAVLFGGVTAILPIFAAEILYVGPTGLGILRAAPSAGALLTSIFLIRFPVSRSAGRILLAAVAGFGFCMIAFAFSREFWLSVMLLALSGALDSVSMVIRGAVVQLSSPDAMRGRVAAVNSIFIGSSNEIGAFESGVAAKLLGPETSVVFGGAMTLLVVLITARLAPKLREMDLSKI